MDTLTIGVTPAKAGAHASLRLHSLAAAMISWRSSDYANGPFRHFRRLRHPANLAERVQSASQRFWMSETLEQRAVARCTDEIARAVLYQRAWRGISEAKAYHGVDFIFLAHLALRDQMFAHAIKVLQPMRGRAGQDLGLWFLVRKHKATVARLCAAHGIFLGHVRGVAGKLETIRNTTHFHLDKEGVRDPSRVWKAAALTKKQLDDALDASLRLLLLLHIEIKGAEYPMPWYDGLDATKITQHAYEHRLLCLGKPPSPKLAALYA